MKMNKKAEQRRQEKAAMELFCRECISKVLKPRVGKIPLTQEEKAALSAVYNRLRRDLEGRRRWRQARAVTSKNTVPMTQEEFDWELEKIGLLLRIVEQDSPQLTRAEKLIFSEIAEQAERVRKVDDKLSRNLQKARMVLEESPTLQEEKRQIVGRAAREKYLRDLPKEVVKKGGEIGGRSRAENLSAERRREIARKAAEARWKKT
jgi:hypothetical protein